MAQKDTQRGYALDFDFCRPSLRDNFFLGAFFLDLDLCTGLSSSSSSELASLSLWSSSSSDSVASELLLLKFSLADSELFSASAATSALRRPAYIARGIYSAIMCPMLFSIPLVIAIGHSYHSICAGGALHACQIAMGKQFNWLPWVSFLMLHHHLLPLLAHPLLLPLAAPPLPAGPSAACASPYSPGHACKATSSTWNICSSQAACLHEHFILSIVPSACPGSAHALQRNEKCIFLEQLHWQTGSAARHGRTLVAEPLPVASSFNPFIWSSSVSPRPLP